MREIPRVGGRARAIGKRVKKRARGGAGTPKVTVSVSTHVPKPHTPFQWCAMDTPGDGAREAALARGRGARGERRAADARLRDVVARGRLRARRPAARRRARARVPGGRALRLVGGPEEDATSGRPRSRAEGVDPAKYLGTIPVTARLPWDHIDVGLEEGFLAARVPEGLKNRLSLPCGKVAGAFVHADEPRGRRAPTRASSSATTAASRATCRRCASSASCTCASSAPRSRGRLAAPRSRRAPAARGRRRALDAGRGAALPLRLREARRRGVPVAPRPHPRAASGRSGGSSCRSSTRRASTPSPT